MIDPTTRKGAVVEARLRDELILWLTTVAPDGQPQSSPVWFLLDEGELLLYSKADAPRMRNLRANSLVAANLDGDGRGGGVVSIEGEARVVTEHTSVDDVPPAYIAKYTPLFGDVGGSMAAMVRDYRVTIRIRITRVRAWD